MEYLIDSAKCDFSADGCGNFVDRVSGYHAISGAIVDNHNGKLCLSTVGVAGDHRVLFNDDYIFFNDTYSFLIIESRESIGSGEHIISGGNWNDGGQVVRQASSTQIHHASDSSWVPLDHQEFFVGDERFICFSRVDNEVRLFVNGIFEDSKNWLQLSTPGLGIKYLMGRNYGGGVTGRIFRAMGWSVGLSDNEIIELFYMYKKGKL